MSGDAGLAARLAELARAASVGGAGLVPSSLEELLGAIAQVAQLALRARGASIALLDGDELVFEVVTGPAAPAVAGMRMPAGEGIAGWALTSGQPVVVHDVASDTRFSLERAGQVGYTPTSILAAPLETERETLGVIEVLDAHDGATSTSMEDLQLLTALSGQAALALETRAAFAEVGRRLFKVLAGATTDTDLAAALLAAAALPAGEDDADLPGLLGDLGGLGEAERATATRLLAEFVAYARAARGRP